MIYVNSNVEWKNAFWGVWLDFSIIPVPYGGTILFGGPRLGEV